ncbi:MAG: hypothetical protein WDZ50_04790 [Woeseia sp.]
MPGRLRDTHRLLACTVTPLFVVLFVVLFVAFLKEPIPQDPAYHEFADVRYFFGVPNFWNVMSNLPFVIVGTAGLALLNMPNRLSLLPELQGIYGLLFAGWVVTGFGSAWYHLQPNNSSLVWDRLGITVAIAALFSVVVGEHMSPRCARRLILPLVLVGVASVSYWAFTESRGAGDLRPYALFQFLPMVLIPLILLRYPSSFDRYHFFWWAIALYAVAKLFEHGDSAVYHLGELIGGHALKHSVAAIAMLVILLGMHRRTLHR